MTKEERQQKNREAFFLLLKFTAIPAVILAAFYQTVVPVIIAVIALFGILSFVNGLGNASTTRTRRDRSGR